MQWRKAAASTVLVVAGLVLAQGGCAPDIGSPVPMSGEATAPVGTPARLTPEVVGGVAPDLADNAPEVTDNASRSTVSNAPGAGDHRAPDRADSSGSASPEGSKRATAVSRAPARNASASPVASPSVAPTPKEAPAASTPAAQMPAEVVAVTLAKENRIALIDPETGKVARMMDLSRPAGRMAIAPDGHSAWVFGTRPGQSTVGLFDALTGKRSEDLQFKEGDGPDAVAFSTDGTRAFVAMGADQPSRPSASTIAFASTSGKEFGRITVGRQTKGVQIRRHLSSLAISPGPDGDVLYAAGEASGVVWALDASSGAVLNEIEVGGGPISIVMDPARQRAYVLLDTLNQVVGIDTTTLAITNRLNLPARAIAAAVGADGTVFITGGDASGELWVVEPSATDIRSRVPIGGRPVGLAISSDGKSLYVGDSATSELVILSADTIQVTRTIKLASEPLSLVDARASTSAQQLAASPTTAARPTPIATPNLVPTPTPLPEGARQPDQLPADAVAEPFVNGAEAPVALAFAPDGRLFYNEFRTGKIRVVQNGMLLPEPFYQFLVSDQPESGLMGLTLDPNFQDNHYAYAFFTSVPVDDTAGRGASGPNAVVRLTDVDNKGTDLTPVLQDLPSGDIHNSGALQFGPDGKLYVSLGDNDKGTYAQDLNTLAGKILRVNPEGSIPDDNPFVGGPGNQGAIWAYGLHNTSSFAFHPVGHELLAADNGRGDHDELELIGRGANYGWPATAGYRFKAGVNDPIAVMNPSIGPTGSTFYTGDQMPEWKNDWFYCNSEQGQLRRVRLTPGSFDRVVFEHVVKQGCSAAVVTGPDGALYYSDARGIYRIRRSGADVLPAVKMGVISEPTAIGTP
jgi:glucose/arabinose dehydrogenase